MILAFEGNMSNRGWDAANNGLLPLDGWNKEAVINKIIKIKQEHLSSPIICFEDLKTIPIHILAKFCMWRAEWHHVNFRPCWFYDIDEYSVLYMTQDEIEAMKMFAEYESTERHKPSFAKVKLSQWKKSTSNHEFCSHRFIDGVIYAGDVYFENGNCIPLKPEYCEIEKIHHKKTKKQKDVFNRIRKQMRKYGVFC